MNIDETKHKLEFEKITNRIKHYAYSETGKDKCDSITFFTNRADLERELEKVLQMKEILNIAGDLPLDGLKDIRNSINKIKIEGFFIGPDELLTILDFLRVSRKTNKFIAGINADNPSKIELIYQLSKNLFYDKLLEHNIEITVDENGEVKDTASSVLNKIRKQINIQSERLRKSLANILKRVSEKEYSQEDIVTQRDGRFVIPVKVENKKDVPGIIHSSSGSGATVFVEPTETINLNNEITELHFEEHREIEKILRELALQIAEHYDEIKTNIELLSEIDFLQAKAKYAIETISSKPKISDSALRLINAFHPVLLQTHKRSEVIPLNLTLGEQYNTLVISGPNAGGKTVVLKTIGLTQLMLQSGILIPSDSQSEFRIFENISISIGDEQSLENDLSTFSSHLKSIKEIIDIAGGNSLVLIDEIASGTDPVLGSAISSAILSHLSNQKCFTIVTTHNSELKEFAYSTEGIENASLEFNVSTLSPNFRFVAGIPGQSFTFEIAKKFSFPESIISEAKKYLDENESRLEDLLKDLNESKQKYNSLKNKTDIENSRLSGLTNLYEQKIKELNQNEKFLKQKAKLEAEKIIKDAGKLIEKTIKEIREEKLTPKKIKSDFQKEALILTKAEFPIEEDTAPAKIEITDFVRIKGSHTSGEVLDISGNMASVNANGIILKAKLSDLEKISRKENQNEFSSSGSVEVNYEKPEFDLDLRGKYTHEIENELEKFIHQSIRNGLRRVSVIHGKGSGKLREEVSKQLKKNSYVKSFRPGNWNEGDMGVTIIEL